MPTWFLVMIWNWLYKKSTSVLANEIRRSDPALIPALKKFQEGAPFMEIVRAYAIATGNQDDDEVINQLMTKPFKEVLAGLAGNLGAIHIPDGDGDPTNDISIGEVLSRVVEKVVQE